MKLECLTIVDETNNTTAYYNFPEDETLVAISEKYNLHYGWLKANMNLIKPEAHTVIIDVDKFRAAQPSKNKEEKCLKQSHLVRRPR